MIDFCLLWTFNTHKKLDYAYSSHTQKKSLFGKKVVRDVYSVPLTNVW